MKNMNAKKTFDVFAEREGKWWVFTIPELDTVGQARNLNELHAEAQTLVEMWLDAAADSVAVNITFTGEDEILGEWQRAIADEEAARAAQVRAAQRRRTVVQTLLDRGFSAPDAGRLLGISKQRIYQLRDTKGAA